MRKKQENLHDEFIALVEQALTIPAADRPAWMKQQAPQSQSAELERMLELVQPTAAESKTQPYTPIDLLGQRVGAYRLTARLGAGGIGQVYRAERCDDEFEQTVAIKVLALPTASTAVTAQFELERQLLASLQHPNIAGLLGGGCTDEGLHYAIMEFIDGVPLDLYLSQHALGTDELVHIFLRLCDAVQAAHEALVIHRDITPQNILITPDGEPKLVDFGIARRLSTQNPTSATILGAMTPAYASPEQLRGDRLTTASDVYSLGVVLYQALCDRLPFDIEGLSAASHLHLLEHTAIVPPGERTPGRRAHRRDLDAVVLKALDADAERRYRSADAMGRDLTRALRGEPVVAKAPSKLYRLARLMGRHRTATAGVGVALCAVFFGLGASLWQISVARAQTDWAHLQLARAEVVSAYLGDLLSGGAKPWSLPVRRGNAQASVGEVLDSVESTLESTLSEYPDIRIELMTRLSEAYLYLNRGERAAELMYQAIDVADAKLPADSPLRVDVRYHLGSALLDEGIYNEALGMLNAALSVSEAQGTLGNLRWIYIMTETALAYSGLGNFQRALSVHLEAERRWLELAGEDPMPAWAEGFFSRAYFEFALGDLNAASRSLERAQLAIELFPDQTRFARADVFGLAGRIAYHRTQPEQGQQHFSASLRAAQDDFDDSGAGYPLLLAGSQLAIIYCETGQLESAEALLEDIQRRLPEHLRYGDGWIYHLAQAECANAVGDYARAIEHVTEAERLGRVWPHALVHVARREGAKATAYAGLGEPTKAQQTLQASRALYAAWLDGP